MALRIGIEMSNLDKVKKSTRIRHSRIHASVVMSPLQAKRVAAGGSLEGKPEDYWTPAQQALRAKIIRRKIEDRKIAKELGLDYEP